MFWSRIAGIYDLIENVYNGKANRQTTDYVASRWVRMTAFSSAPAVPACSA